MGRQSTPSPYADSTTASFRNTRSLSTPGSKTMPPTELIILVGLQGSGKSTFYQTFFPSTHDWVSKDRFRNNRNPARRQRKLIEAGLQAGRSVVVDNTSLTTEDRAELIALGRASGARVIGFYFESRVEDCLERNRPLVANDR